jgi:hypothetical protein
LPLNAIFQVRRASERHAFHPTLAVSQVREDGARTPIASTGMERRFAEVVDARLTPSWDFFKRAK